jgi:glutamate N-acetyltransferase/amino-acid N-acetyltransferase
VNAGNANCATGSNGIAACESSCTAAAAIFDCTVDEVFPSSTGIIGVPLPTEKLVAALPAVNAALGATEEHAALFAGAIMTTDTRPKTAHASIEVNGKQVRLYGFAKGAGMIHPPACVRAGPGARHHACLSLYRCRRLRRGVAGHPRNRGGDQFQLHLH